MPIAHESQSPSPERLRQLLQFLPVFTTGSEAERDEQIGAFLSCLYSTRTLADFDWAAWQPTAQRLLDPDAIASASLLDLRRLLTLHARKDRFCEGHLSEMAASGHLGQVLQRLQALLDQPTS